MHTAGALLTGGASRRLGYPKAEVVVAGERLVDRSARVLQAACSPVLEVGPGLTELPAVREDPPGSGPLAALAAATRALVGRRHAGPLLVLAVDLPYVDVALLRWLAQHPSPLSVVPTVDGRAQPLCARYSPDALAASERLGESGERAMHALLAAVDVEYVDERHWGSVSTATAFFDVDTPEDAARVAERGAASEDHDPTAPR